MAEKYSYAGAIHIHSKFSDGTGDVFEISKAAKNAGLKWIIITDHDCMDIEEGIFNEVYVIKGEEISPKVSNHYLAFGINNVIPSDIAPCDYIDSVRENGGFGFVAHPDESEKRKNSARPIRWEDKSLMPDGIEIWNWFSDWADHYDDSSIFSVAYSYIFRHNLVKGPKNETIHWWDNLNNKSDRDIVPAICGVDAHALRISKYILPVTVFPYISSFKTLTNVLYLPERLPMDFVEAKKLILEAIKSGNNLIINRHISAAIPDIFVSNSLGDFYCGDTLKKDDTTFLNIKTIKGAEFKIFLNGKIYDIPPKEGNSYKLEKVGKYRVEIYLKGRPWVFSNPIIVS